MARFPFLCEGTIESLSAPVPTSMLEAYPEEVRTEARIPVRDLRRSVCRRIVESKNCNTNNCAHLHPDFLNEQWAVPDIICHKWFQGCCDRNTYCWNQHGFTFDQALRVQNQFRGGGPPYAYSSEDGCIQQVNREHDLWPASDGPRSGSGTTTDGKQSVLPEMTNHTPARSDELRIDFERRSIDTQTYATVVEAGGKESACARDSWHIV